MGKIWYLSPSCQAANVGVNGYGSEMEQMYRLALAISPHLDHAGVSFVIADRGLTLQQRVAESNRIGAAFHLAFHSNAGGSGSACGPVAYYYSDTGRALGGRLVAALLALGQKSNRAENLRQDRRLYELCRTSAPACLLEVDFHDSATGVAFLTERREEIAACIARVIIREDGKEFVPEDASCIKCRDWGLFEATGSSYRWGDAMTRQEAAAMAVRLRELVEREVMKK